MGGIMKVDDALRYRKAEDMLYSRTKGYHHLPSKPSALDQNYRDQVERFADALQRVREMHPMRMTPTMHILLRHVPVFIDQMQLPLRRSSEETVEDQHNPFTKFYNKYAVTDANSTIYSQRLLSCVVHYNAYYT